jgi:protein phosphatase
LGTRDGDFLHPIIQRFIVEDEGLLLLCSDGLSDNDWVEQSWESYGPAVLKGEMSLEAAVQYLINVGNEKNGYDNTSVVMTHCRMSPEKLMLFQPNQVAESATPMSNSMPTPMTGSVSLKKSLLMPQTQPNTKLSESSKQLLYPETAAQEPAQEQAQEEQRFRGFVPILGILAIVLACGGLGLWVRNLQNSQPEPGQIPPPVESPSPTPSEIPSPSPELPSPELPAPPQSPSP